MLSEVFVGLVEEAIDGSFFESSVHAFDLAVGPGVLGLGQTMVDIGFGAGELEGVGTEELAALESEFQFIFVLDNKPLKSGSSEAGPEITRI